jgi:hypothetical protein
VREYYLGDLDNVEITKKEEGVAEDMADADVDAILGLDL